MRNLLKNKAVQSMIASLLCIILGLFLGYIVLLFINPDGAGGAIMAVIKNFLNSSRANLRIKSFGNTLVKTAPLLMCSLSVLFAYKVGLFNIGAAGQYVVGSCACLIASLGWGWGWFACLLFALVVGAVYGAIVGLLKAYCNVNEVISGIMLNWIGLYTSNMILSSVDLEPENNTTSLTGTVQVKYEQRWTAYEEGSEVMLGTPGAFALSKDEKMKLVKVSDGEWRIEDTKNSNENIVVTVGSSNDEISTVWTGTTTNDDSFVFDGDDYTYEITCSFRKQ